MKSSSNVTLRQERERKIRNRIRRLKSIALVESPPKEGGHESNKREIKTDIVERTRRERVDKTLDILLPLIYG